MSFTQPHFLDGVHRSWPCFPPTARIELSQQRSMCDPLGQRVAAHVTGTNVVFYLTYSDQRGMMKELSDKLDAHLAHWLRSPMRAGRHDRGWPKVAA